MSTLPPAAKRAFKDAVYGALSRVPAALANPHRLELLDLLSQRAWTVQDAASELNLSVANASQHLQVLAKCGLVTVERLGTFAYYRTAGREVNRLASALRDVAESKDGAVASAVKKHLGPREAYESAADLAGALRQVRDALRAKDRILLDTRPVDEFASGHLPGAINAPLDSLKSGKLSLQKSKHYIVYCRGPYCLFADEAVLLLRDRGVEATRLSLGPAEWEAHGGRLERTA